MVLRIYLRKTRDLRVLEQLEQVASNARHLSGVLINYVQILQCDFPHLGLLSRKQCRIVQVSL